jgi:ribose transport system ATP-binding protein
MAERFLSIKGISKRFGGVHALSGVDVEILSGEIHSIIGENGAGKSTLLRIISGALHSDSGNILLHQKDITNADPNNLFKAGISVAFQETSLFENLTVAENLFLGTLYNYRGLGIDWKKAETEAQAILDGFELSGINPNDPLSSLSTEMRQIIEILKAVKDNPVLLCLDEPTSALTFESVRRLFGLLGRLKEAGTTIIYVSHHLDEILEISDRITVLRDGKKVDTISRQEASKPVLHELMVGRRIASGTVNRQTSADDRMPILECSNISDGEKVSNVSLSVFEGEILGITGLVGSGRSELAWLIYGLNPLSDGSIKHRGEVLEKHSADKAIERGIIYLPEERRQMGIFLDQDLIINTTISKLDKVTKGRLINFRNEKQKSGDMLQSVQVRYQSLFQSALSLSGGNQQKLLLGKCLFTDPDLLILDEPTRGIDVGSKEEIYNFIKLLSKNGLTVIVVSSEVEEICLLCNRVLVMSQGDIIGEFKGEGINERSITACYLKANE